MAEFYIRSYEDLTEYKHLLNSEEDSKNTLIVYLSGFYNLKNITFNHDIEFRFKGCSENIEIENITFNKNCSIGDLQVLSKKVGLRFVNCIFKGEFIYDDRNYAPIFDFITFDTSKFEGRTVFRGVNAKQLNFLGNISNSNFLTRLNNRCFIEVTGIEKLSFTGAKINSELNISGQGNGEISFSSNIINGSIYINAVFTSLKFYKFYLDTIGEIYKGGEIYIDISENIDTGKIIFSSIEKLDKVKITSASSKKIGELCIDNVDWKFNFFNFEVGLFRIENSNLNKSEFNSLKINSLHLYNSIVQDSIYNGNIFPEGYELLKNGLNNHQLKDNYRQLKYTFDRIGNTIEANKFYAKEMKYHGKNLNWKNTPFEKFIFKLQEYISIFGNSWIRPIILLIGIILLKCSIDIYELEGKIIYMFGFDNFLDFLWDFLIKFLNLFSENLIIFYQIYTSGTITFIDTILNILCVILIYHIVVAFKRTTKR